MMRTKPGIAVRARDVGMAASLRQMRATDPATQPAAGRGLRTVLCFGDSNTYGAVPMRHMLDCRRFGREDRWPGVLQKELMTEWTVIEDGLPGRTTVHADPIEGLHKNGLRHLPVSLESHAPLDLVVLMLGTNDLKIRFSVSAADVASSVRVLITAVRASANADFGRPPEVLLVAPPPISEIGVLAPMFEGAAAKSRRLAALYQSVAKAMGASFIDAATSARVSRIDGVHFSANQHGKLGRAIAKYIRSMSWV